MTTESFTLIVRKYLTGYESVFGNGVTLYY